MHECKTQFHLSFRTDPDRKESLGLCQKSKPQNLQIILQNKKMPSLNSVGGTAFSQHL